MQKTSAARQRAASLVHLPPLLLRHGVPLDAVLAETGVAASDLAPDRFIDYAAYLQILENAARLTACSDIGLQLGQCQTLASLGPLGKVMRCASHLGEAMADFAAFQISNSTGAAVYMHRVGDEVSWGYGIHDPASRASPYIHDVVLAVGRNFVAELTQGAVTVMEFNTMRPAPQDPAPWRAALGARIRFGQEQTCLYLSRADTAFRLPSADPAARSAALGELAALLRFAPWGWTGRTRHALPSLLLEGRSKMPEAARQLGLHPRTLRRALEREGSSFETIKEDVRQVIARELLFLTDLQISDLAMSLDFASPSAFIHAFRRWTGATPAAWRNHQRETPERHQA